MMVRISRKHLSEITCCLFLFFVLLTVEAAEAANRELQLFDHAYHAYLSYRPEKAVDEFRIFLQEFPDSSARDAALFWLAKSLLQTNSIEEAKKTFAYVKEQFPESPFICFIATELGTLGNEPEEHIPLKPAAGAEAQAKPVLSEIPVAAAVSSEQKAPYVADIPTPKVILPRGQASSEKGAEREKTSQDTLSSSKMDPDEKPPIYALQVASFRNKDSAVTLRKNLQKKIPTKKVTICQQGDFFKVRIAGFDKVEEANSMLQAGIDGVVIKTSEKACGIENQSLALLP
jgi:cell division septation protein DedD